MAKNWYDGPIPTPGLGLLGDMPSMDMTEDDKRRRWQMVLQNMGMNMAAASLMGANTSQAMGKGLIGGFEGWQQGSMAPNARMDAYGKQLKMQGDQIGNAKGLAELAKLQREAADYSKQNDFYSLLNDPGRAAMLYGGGPSVQNEQRATQFGANPASLFADPRINAAALAARVDPKQLGSALENTRPFKMDAGSVYQNANGTREQIPLAQAGMTMTRLPDGSYTAAPIAGYNAIIGDQELNKSMAQNNARLWLEAQQRKNTVVPQTMQSGKTQPVTAEAQLNYARNNDSSVFNIPPAVQAQRDAIAQDIYRQEGAGKYSPRLNDRADVTGVRPQVANLDLPGGASPIVTDATKALNTDWVEKTYRPIQEAGAAAQGNIDVIRGLRNINLSTGMGTELKSNLAALGASFGIKNAENYAGRVQQFQSLAMDSVNKSLMEAKGIQTEGDAMRAQKIFASIKNVDVANQYILDLKEAAERKKQRAAAFYEDAIPIARQSGDLTEINRRWRKIAGSIWDDPILQKWAQK